MSFEIPISVNALNKLYQVFDQPQDRLKQFLIPKIQRALGIQPKQYHREFWALKDICFDVKKGETVGIIGCNGSGKSTLLQIICGTLNLTSGNIKTHGRIAALLELGSGFNPEFTGRENVFINASVLGLSKEEIDARFDKIVSFADIGNFIEQPIKTYSSGMIVRLAFAIAIHVDAEIIVIDEALAVGDIAFQYKCLEKIKNLKTLGVTILFVSHDTGSIIEFCNRAIVLDSGEIVFIGDPKDAVGFYRQLLSNKSNFTSLNVTNHFDLNDISNLQAKHKINPDKEEYGNGAAVIFDWGILNADRTLGNPIENSDVIEIIISVRFNRPSFDPIVGYFLTDVKGREIVGTNTKYEGLALGPKKAGDKIRVSFKQSLRVSSGEYFLNIGCSENIENQINALHRLYRITVIPIHSRREFVGFFYSDTKVSVSVAD